MPDLFVCELMTFLPFLDAENRLIRNRRQSLNLVSEGSKPPEQILWGLINYSYLWKHR